MRQDPQDSRILSEDQSNEILRLMEKLPVGGGSRGIALGSFWQGSLRWARNRPYVSSNRRGALVYVMCNIDGKRGMAVTNQLDRISLENAMRRAEHNSRMRRSLMPPDMFAPPPGLPLLSTTTWSEATAARTSVENAKAAQTVSQASSRENLLSAGFMDTGMMSVAHCLIEPAHEEPIYLYGAQTNTQFSVTVRHPKGMGSGWAGRSGFDVSTIDEYELADKAIDKCMRSIDPVRIEPGRYTVILEPQAVSDIMEVMMDPRLLGRAENETGGGPFAFPQLDVSLNRYRSKLGLKVMDERITISHDPADPDLGIIAVPGLQPVTWVKNGVLMALPHERLLAVNERTAKFPDMWRNTYRMHGGSSTLDEMIQSSERAILITRFSQPLLLDPMSFLATGLTRDGLWLIENGKVSRAIRNFRWTESPLFMLNNVEELGQPVQVFRPQYHIDYATLAPWYSMSTVIVPPVKARDFSFTSTVDAV